MLKAYVLHGVNDLRFEEVAKPTIKKGEVLVAVKAVGICGSDIPRIYETGAHKHPLIPGHEFSGVVVSAADENDSSWINKRVGVFPLIPCYECDECKNNLYEMCRNYSYIGSRRDGAFAEYVSVPIENLIELPEEISFEEAAMLEPMAVAVHAIRRALLKPSDKVALCGLGTIGVFVSMFLKTFAISDFVLIGKKEIQRKTLADLGFSKDSFCDIRNQEALQFIKSQTGGRGVDVFFECVGRNDTINMSVKGTAPSGNVILVGNPASDITLSKNIYWKILRHQLRLSGTWNSSFLHSDDDDWHYVVKQIRNKIVEPDKVISHRIPFSNLKSGLQIMKDKTEDYIKIMIIME